MPDTRKHRGPHPRDNKLFAVGKMGKLRQAVEDYSLLLTKGYAEKSSLKLVGDRFELSKRQRLAVMRTGYSDQQVEYRRRHEVDIEQARAEAVGIDGYNVLITIESAMSGGMIFKGRDGCYKDLASIHGTYRKVSETIPALALIGDFLEENGFCDVTWLLDKPVSNSGRLKKLIEGLAEENRWGWNVELTISPDARLIKSDMVAASTDSVVLDRCGRWVNLAAKIIQSRIESARLVDLCV